MPRAAEWLNDYLEKQIRPQNVVGETDRRWRPADLTPVKINVDAACFEGRGTGWGVVVRDEEGRCLLAGVKRSRIHWEPDLAEAKAIEYGLELARRFSWLEVEMESDCLGVIHTIRREEEGRTELGCLCATLRAQAQDLVKVIRNFTGRGKNQVAHAMAQVEGNWGEKDIWVDNPPIFIVPLLREDLFTNSDST
ncbi:unnamed protein product [Linum trigynum]|uniref:RNase H type-1 domain-containing protein n=1 Tax=Linum trigynum TaxID=586398 RepID=A0AAV2ER66_9ROSI